MCLLGEANIVYMVSISKLQEGSRQGKAGVECGGVEGCDAGHACLGGLGRRGKTPKTKLKRIYYYIIIYIKAHISISRVGGRVARARCGLFP